MKKIFLFTLPFFAIACSSDDEKKPVFIHPGQLMDIYISQVMIQPQDSATNTIIKPTNK